VVSLMGGLLPFGSIFIEMYCVRTSFWNYKVYIQSNSAFRENGFQWLLMTGFLVNLVSRE
jgi:hypothetical protein